LEPRGAAPRATVFAEEASDLCGAHDGAEIIATPVFLPEMPARISYG
jgi:hypothetical protein